MAEKRMFTKSIIDSDAFLEMPLSAQALYFHLNMRADDDGFVNNPKRITDYVNASADDLKILLAKRFIIRFDSGVIVIKHWRMHNTLRSDRYLAQVIEPLLQLRRYTESELMAALVQSFFTAWIETETDQSGTPFNEVGAGDIAGVPTGNPDGYSANNLSDDPNEYEMGPGTVTHLAPGEKVNFGNPNIPTAGFETFVKTVCRLIGSALELPYDVLIKEFNSSYSASRGALLEAWEAFKMRRSWFVNDFCQPVYELFLAEAVALGRIKAPGFYTDPLLREAWCGARWIGPVQGSLDPKKEAEAALMLTGHAIKTHDQVTREMSGGDWEENVDQLARENELLAASGSNPSQESAAPSNNDGGNEE